MNHWTPLILHGCQTCCLTLVGYVLGFCGITLALSGRKDVPVLTVPQHSIQNLLAAFPYNGRATCGTFFAFQARTTSWNEVWYSVTWQAWAQLSAHVPCCWSSWENMHPIVLREVKITVRYTQVHLCTSMHLHCLSPPSFFFFLVGVATCSAFRGSSNLSGCWSQLISSYGRHSGPVRLSV